MTARDDHLAARRLVERRQGKNGLTMFVHRHAADQHVSHIFGVPLRRRPGKGPNPKFPMLDRSVEVYFVICRAWDDTDNPLRPGNEMSRCEDCRRWVQHRPGVPEALPRYCVVCGDLRLNGGNMRAANSP